jgi:catechol 2,3-dioxygenase-like lactoylglutathione lyase family enzyme
MPRCGFFIRTEDIDTHLGRLKQHGIPHSDPVRISNEGDEGTTIYFEDPDGNQYEFWAPVHMPEGAMAVATPHNVGRISHVVYGSRNLEKTAAFFREYCGLRQIDSPEIPQETLVLRLLGGARLVYKLADSVDERVTGHGSWWDVHTALTVRDEEFFPNYRRMWDGLPEEEGAKENMSLSLAEEDALPPRTGLHRSIWGYMWKERYKRGDEFYDWDGHAFHFSGGLSETADGSLTVYRTKDPDSYLRELTEKVETGALA